MLATSILYCRVLNYVTGAVLEIGMVHARLLTSSTSANLVSDHLPGDLAYNTIGQFVILDYNNYSSSYSTTKIHGEQNKPTYAIVYMQCVYKLIRVVKQAGPEGIQRTHSSSGWGLHIIGICVDCCAPVYLSQEEVTGEF